MLSVSISALANSYTPLLLTAACHSKRLVYGIFGRDVVRLEYCVGSSAKAIASTKYSDTVESWPAGKLESTTE